MDQRSLAPTASSNPPCYARPRSLLLELAMARPVSLGIRERRHYRGTLFAHLNGTVRPWTALPPDIVRLVRGGEPIVWLGGHGQDALEASVEVHRRSLKGKRGRRPHEAIEVLGAGPPRFERDPKDPNPPDPWPPEVVEAWAIDFAAWVYRVFQGECVIGGIWLHRDETSPHVHVIVMPRAEGRVSWKAVKLAYASKVLGRLPSKIHFKAAYRAIRDGYYEEVGKKYGLSRGRVRVEREEPQDQIIDRDIAAEVRAAAMAKSIVILDEEAETSRARNVDLEKEGARQTQILERVRRDIADSGRKLDRMQREVEAGRTNPVTRRLRKAGRELIERAEKADARAAAAEARASAAEADVAAAWARSTELERTADAEAVKRYKELLEAKVKEYEERHWNAVRGVVAETEERERVLAVRESELERREREPSVQRIAELEGKVERVEAEAAARREKIETLSAQLAGRYQEGYDAGRAVESEKAFNDFVVFLAHNKVRRIRCKREDGRQPLGPAALQRLHDEVYPVELERLQKFFEHALIMERRYAERDAKTAAQMAAAAKTAAPEPCRRGGGVGM